MNAYEKVERGILQTLLSPPFKLKILKTSVVIQYTLCELIIDNNDVFWHNYEVRRVSVKKSYNFKTIRLRCVVDNKNHRQIQ
jgi:hypothetical protein